MIPFPGESLGVDYAQHIGGDEITSALRPRAGSDTLASGEEWRAWVYPGGPTYLESDAEPVVVSWVVEVASGTVTLGASMGMDPSWGDTGAAHPTSLGTHTVTGPATLVLATTITAADVLTGDDAPMLVLQATSGSAVVQQVKLRVWPPGGAAGGWSDTLAGFYSGAGTNPTIYAQTLIPLLEGSEVGGSAEAAWDALIAVVSGTPAPTYDDTYALASIGALGGGVTTASVIFNGDDEWEARAETNAGSLTILIGADPDGAYPISDDLTEEVDYIRPPTEVQDDYAAWVQQDGSASVDWIDATATVDLTEPTNGVALVTVHVASDAVDDLTVTPIGLTEADIPGVAFDAGGTGFAFDPGAPVTDTVPLATGGRYIVVSVAHIFDASLAWPGWNPVTIGASESEVNSSGVTSELKSRVSLPPYRVWNPTVAAVYPMRLMQRGDGLGMGSSRVLGAGTRQSSTRLFGSY
jgi:hypothetical protein